MAQHIGIIQISHPGPTDESQNDTYWTGGLGSQLRSMYGELLGMVPIHIGYHKLVHEDGRILEIGFEYSPRDVRPRWPDPAHPQQVHLDVEVADVDAAERLVLAHGARHLASFDDHRVFEDPAGHPFCVYPGSPGAAHGDIARVVFDCHDPRSLASFYEELLDLSTRVVDTMDRVEIAGGGHRVALAFQRSPCLPPQWPDPARPHQLHLDVVLENPVDANGQSDWGPRLCHCPSVQKTTCSQTPPATPSVSASGSRVGPGGQPRSPPTSVGWPSTRPASRRCALGRARTAASLPRVGWLAPAGIDVCRPAGLPVRPAQAGRRRPGWVVDSTGGAGLTYEVARHPAPPLPGVRVR